MDLTNETIDHLCTTYHLSGRSYDLAKAEQLQNVRSGEPLTISYEEAEQLCTRYDGLAKITDLTSLITFEEAMGLR